MKPALGASAVVAFALAAGLTPACSGPASVPPDYHRIGAAGTDVLYAKITRESDGDYADVLLRTTDGDTLCDARGPLMTDAARGFAICSDQTPRGLRLRRSDDEDPARDATVPAGRSNRCREAVED